MTSEQSNRLSELYDKYLAQKSLYDKEKLLNGEWHYNFDRSIWIGPASLGSYHYTGSTGPSGMQIQVAYSDEKLAMYKRYMDEAKSEYDAFQEDLRQIASTELELAQINATPKTKDASTTTIDPEVEKKAKRKKIIIWSCVGLGIIVMASIIIYAVKQSNKNSE